MKKMILASASPRRKQLLEQAGFKFEVCVSNKEEKKGNWTPKETVEILSSQKAMDVFNELNEACIVIGADTVVACDDQILGKPKNEKDAFHMLSMLQGRTHQVFTGVTIIEGTRENHTVITFSEVTHVSMYPATEKMLMDYIATGDPMDKAGAYGIQGPAAVFVKEIHGDYNNVVGLPIAAIWQHFNS